MEGMDTIQEREYIWSCKCRGSLRYILLTSGLGCAACRMDLVRGSLLQTVNPTSDWRNIPSSTQSGQSQLTFLRNGSQELPVQRQRKRDPVSSLSKWYLKKALRKYVASFSQGCGVLDMQELFVPEVVLKYTNKSRGIVWSWKYLSVLGHRIIIQQKKNFELDHVCITFNHKFLMPTIDFENSKWKTEVRGGEAKKTPLLQF